MKLNIQWKKVLYGIALIIIGTNVVKSRKTSAKASEKSL